MDRNPKDQYRSLPDEDEDCQDGEPESSNAYAAQETSRRSFGTRPSPTRKKIIGLVACLKQSKPIRPPLNLRDGQVRLPNEKYVYQLTAFVSIGAFLFGYDQGVMGVIVADARWKDLMRPRNSWVTGAIISLYDLGCLFGALLLAPLADTLSRERALSLAALLALAGALLQSAAPGISLLLLGRSVLGVGVGVASAGVPLYVAEIAPPHARGTIVALEQMVLCAGELVAFAADFAFARWVDGRGWWRVPLGLQVVPAGVLAVGCWAGWVLPSPRWLVGQGRARCAREVLVRLRGSARAEEEMREIERELEWEREVMQVGWGEMFRGAVGRVTALGMGVQFFQQITGTNSILYYAPTLFEKGGIRRASTRNLATGGIGLVLFATSWIPIFIFDRLPRRTWLQLGTLGMMVSMLGIAAVQSHAERHPDDPVNFSIVVFPYLFYVFFNLSWAVGSWTYAAEIFPLGMRAKGSALSTMSLWGACLVVAQATPVVEERVGWGLYVIYAGICVVALVFVRYAMVETRGRTLEEMSHMFGINRKLVGRDGALVDSEDEEDDDAKDSEGGG
ncbi:MAG: hypothetical protein Q9165_008204 [Trypethelium subeluteriae]